MTPIRIPLVTLGAIAAGQRVPVDITKLRGLGQERDGDQILKVARLILQMTTRITTTAAAQTGIVPGRRRAEILQNVRLAPVAWPVKYSHDVGGRALRQLALAEHRNGGAVVDATDQADADSANDDRVIVIPIEFYRSSSRRPEDLCPPALHVGAGNLEIAAAIPNGLTGWSAAAIQACTVLAEVFWGDREAPVFSRIQERVVATPSAFVWNVNPSRYRRAFLQADGSQTGANSHLPASFDEAVSVNAADVGGERRIDTTRIDTLVDAYNRDTFHGDAAQPASGAPGADRIAQARALPELVPFVWPTEGGNNTELPRGVQDARTEFSAEPRDAATGTAVNVLLVTEELYGPVDGSAELNAFCAAMGVKAFDSHPVTASKVQGIAPHKADAVPRRIIPRAA